MSRAEHRFLIHLKRHGHFPCMTGSGGILQAAVKLGGRRVRGIETLPEWAKKANEAISSTSSIRTNDGSVSSSTSSSDSTPVVSGILKN